MNCNSVKNIIELVPNLFFNSVILSFLMILGNRQPSHQVPEADDPELEKYIRWRVLGQHHRGGHPLRLRPERHEQEEVSIFFILNCFQILVFSIFYFVSWEGGVPLGPEILQFIYTDFVCPQGFLVWEMPNSYPVLLPQGVRPLNQRTLDQRAVDQ